METYSDVFAEPISKCPACAGTDWRNAGQAKDYSVSGEWFELKECTQCHLKMTYPQPSISQIGRYYASQNYVSHTDTKAGIINKLFHSARNYMMKKKLDWVQQASKKQEGRILDVGAGTGYFAAYMKQNGWNVTALEPDESARNIALQKLDIKVDPLEDIVSLPLHSYDVITLWHVLEHVHDPNAYLQRFASLLKSDGVLLIAVPNHTSHDAKNYGPNWAAFDVPRHLWHFSPLSLQKMLHKNGFSLVEKITMPLDGFYVSMLSEKYKGNDFLGLPFAFVSGFRSMLSGRKNVDQSSSIIYISRLVT